MFGPLCRIASTSCLNDVSQKKKKKIMKMNNIRRIIPNNLRWIHSCISPISMREDTFCDFQLTFLINLLDLVKQGLPLKFSSTRIWFIQCVVYHFTCIMYDVKYEDLTVS